MNSFSDLAATISSYTAALFALLGWIVIDHSSTWISLAGFILLVCRMIIEVPKAYRILIPKPKTVIVTVDERGQVIPNRRWWKFGWH